MMISNTGKWTFQQNGVDLQDREQCSKHGGRQEKIAVQPSAIVELAGTAENWLKADRRKLRLRCDDYEAEICERIEMLKHHELVFVQETFRLLLRDKG